MCILVISALGKGTRRAALCRLVALVGVVGGTLAARCGTSACTSSPVGDMRASEGGGVLAAKDDAMLRRLSCDACDNGGRLTAACSWGPELHETLDYVHIYLHLTYA